MKEKNGILSRLDQWLSALSRRERVMVLSALFLVPLYLFVQLVYLPGRHQQQDMHKGISAVQQQNRQLQTQLNQFAAAVNNDPDKQQRQQIEKIAAQITSFDQSFRNDLSSLVPPERMSALLRKMLSRRAGLTLVSVKNLAAQEVPLVTGNNAADSGGKNASDGGKGNDPEKSVNGGSPGVDMGLYRHAVELQFRGSYLAALQYVDDLSKLPQRLFWQGITIETGEHYPQATVRLRLYTLSSEKGWIGG